MTANPTPKTDLLLLEAARGILKREAEGFPDEYGAARLSVLAETAQNAIFNYINSAAHWGNNADAYELLHPLEPSITEAVDEANRSAGGFVPAPTLDVPGSDTWKRPGGKSDADLEAEHRAGFRG